MTSQQAADLALQVWQSNRNLTPEQRIDLAFFDFILPPDVNSDDFDGQLQAVAEAMQEAA